MVAELGGVTGICVPDKIVSSFVQTRERTIYKEASVYFKPDDDANYAATYEIDLSAIMSLIALYPSPDNVKFVTDVAFDLDGCFIGACTTAEEDLIIGGLVLEAGMKEFHLTATSHGIRKMTPGSLPILASLRKIGLIDIYLKAGFEIGAPGCSYCVGMGVDVASEGETWLSSQNRNFPNRLGKGLEWFNLIPLTFPGSFGNICSAATVAASSFNMRVTDPQPFLDKIDHDKLAMMFRQRPASTVRYSEPKKGKDVVDAQSGVNFDRIITGRIRMLGDFVDTDAVSYLAESV